MAGHSFSFNFALDGDNGNGSSANGADGATVATATTVSGPMRPGERFHWTPSRSAELAFAAVTVPTAPPRTFEIVNTTDTGFLARTGSISSILTTSDLQTGVYEGGFKLWECAIDLVQYVDALLVKIGAAMPAKVLELGCGHGLPGIHALQRGAEEVVFMDYNKEVLELTTCPNVLHNVGGDMGLYAKASFYAGDWGSVSTLMRDQERKSEGDLQFDLILTAETIYTEAVSAELFRMIKRHLKRSPASRALVAAKKYYFGTGGSVQQFMDMVAADGELAAELVWEERDFRSNIRDIVEVKWVE